MAKPKAIKNEVNLALFALTYSFKAFCLEI